MRAWFKRRFAKNEDGVVLIETLLASPVLLILTFGILEFGNLMWQRQQLQVGVRDAARYWARCRPNQTLPGGGTATYMSCSQQIARNIAFYGNPNGTGPLRVPGWDNASEITILPLVPDTTPDDTDLVTVTGRFAYDSSPVFGAMFSNVIFIEYWTQTRYLGW